MQRSKAPYIFLGLSAVLAVSALILLLTRPGPLTPPAPPQPTPEKAPNKINNIDQTTPADTSPQLPDALQLKTTSADPARLADNIATALENGDFTTAMHLLGETSADPLTAERLKLLAARKPLLVRPNGIREVGELDGGQRTRWMLELGDEQIQLDLHRVGNAWQVERVTMPKHATSAQIDPLTIADAFLQSVLKQDFETSRRFVDPKTVSYAKIAGLCILFEEGNYILRPKSPLRLAFQRDDTAGYLVSLDATDGADPAQFALNLRQSDPNNWLIVEINLDTLLADFARKFTGGDVYYTPLVKNPSGGDTLALYFDFDADQIDPRTTRQLEIVSMILRSDTAKKIHIGGHTDALGTDTYNLSLSQRRANAVRQFLISASVDPQQIVMKALGASQPLRPNVTDQGEDNPDGRRANRRAEIFLDF
jgi:outer membrane protein OmpA-like peptidoglycan-associated protein